VSYIKAFFAGLSTLLQAIALYGAYKLGKSGEQNAHLEADNAAARTHNQMADTIRAASDDELSARLSKYSRK